MKKTAFLPFLLLCAAMAGAQPAALPSCNLVWTSQSKNSSESMPCGGGDIGLNVWVENGDVLFYVSRTGTFDENNTMLKLGRVRVQLASNPFAGKDFKQELNLLEGGVQINGGGTQLNIWVDVFRPVVHISLKSDKATTITAAYESWRYKDHVAEAKELRAGSYKFPQKFTVTTYRDEIATQNNEVLFYHRNRSDVENIFDYTVKMEQLSAVKMQLDNPVQNRTFGGLLRGDRMRTAGIDSGSYAGTPFKAWRLQTVAPVRRQELTLTLNVAQTPTLEAWKAGLQTITKESDQHAKTALQQSRDWWKAFWNRSYIFTDNNNDSVRAVGRNYQLFRYQLGCNAYGALPTKFNGGLFTFDPIYIDTSYHYSPDFRLWGGGLMTAQNQRLVYHPMLKSGDADMMPSQFNFYMGALHNAELRTKYYWKHGGASFTEQIENFGLPNVVEYVPKRPEGYDPGMEYNAWLEYEWETVFEFCLMMLETERYEGKDITQYIPLIESCLTFYDEHYQYLAKQRSARPFDEKGQYVFYPSSAAESFKMAYNSTTVISALTVILTRMLELPEKYLDSTHREKWTVMLKRIPPVPIGEYEGHKTLAPAQVWARVQNSEAPQLYPVYPWGLYGVGKPGLDTAINTWNYDPQVVRYRSHVGWRQYNIFAARLGLTEEAARYTLLKFADAPHRCPTFWGPGFDWTPDHNWGGSAMIGLQEMLLQADGRKIHLLPAWPHDWSTTFKLHAPYRTTVEGEVKNGKIVHLKVTPQAREKDVIVHGQW